MFTSEIVNYFNKKLTIKIYFSCHGFLLAAAPATAQPVSVVAEYSSLLVTLSVTVAVPVFTPSVTLTNRKYVYIAL